MTREFWFLRDEKMSQGCSCCFRVQVVRFSTLQIFEAHFLLDFTDLHLVVP